METLERIIVQHPFFAALDHAFLDLVVSCASNERFAADAYIFKEGDEANAFFLIREGRVALDISAPEQEPIIVDTLEVGDILGWSWLLPPFRWKFNAHAKTGVRAIALNGECLRNKCEQNHDLGYELLKRFSHMIERRLEAARFQLLDVYGDITA